MTRVAIVAVVLLLYVAISASFVIQGPFPASAVVPVNSYGGFTCELNTSSSELATGNYSGPGWTTWPRATSGSSGISSGGDVIQTSFSFKVTEIYLSGGIVQCRVTLKPSLEVLGANATVLAYGPPHQPSNLSAETPEADFLRLSWTAPPSPDEVQLSYTVTVTNTNTSVVRNYTTSNTSITLTRSDVEGDGERDQYVWSVTAVNPAGISVPANHTTAVSFISAVHVGSTQLFLSSTQQLQTTSTTLPSPQPPPQSQGLLLIYILLAVVGLAIVVVFLVFGCTLVYVTRSLRKVLASSKQITTKNEASSCDNQNASSSPTEMPAVLPQQFSQHEEVVHDEIESEADDVTVTYSYPVVDHCDEIDWYDQIIIDSNARKNNLSVQEKPKTNNNTHGNKHMMAHVAEGVGSERGDCKYIPTSRNISYAVTTIQQHNGNKLAPSTHDVVMMGNPAYEIPHSHPVVMYSSTPQPGDQDLSSPATAMNPAYNQHNGNKLAPSTHDVAMMGNPAYEISHSHPVVMYSSTPQPGDQDLSSPATAMNPAYNVCSYITGHDNIK